MAPGRFMLSSLLLSVCQGGGEFVQVCLEHPEISGALDPRVAHSGLQEGGRRWMAIDPFLHPDTRPARRRIPECALSITLVASEQRLRAGAIPIVAMAKSSSSPSLRRPVASGCRIGGTIPPSSLPEDDSNGR